LSRKTGRPRKPTTLKIAEGTHRKDRDGDPEKEVKGRKLQRNSKPPFKLNRNELAIWKRVLDVLCAKGLATDLDREPIARYCQHSWEARLIRNEIQKKGRLIRGRDKGQWKANPLFTVLRQIERNLMWFESRFGMTPTDRAGLNIENLNISEKAEDGVASRKRKQGS